MRILLLTLLVMVANFGFSQSEAKSFNSSLESIRVLSPNNLTNLESILDELCSDCELIVSSENSKSLELKMNNPFDIYDFLIEANNRNIFIAHISSDFSQTKLSDEDITTQKQFTLIEQKKKFRQNRPTEYNNLLKSNQTKRQNEK